MLREGGAAGLTLRGAARRAGVSQAAPYHHFADKAALLAAVAEVGFDGLEAASREASEGIADPLERFRVRGAAYVAYALEHPDHYRVMFGPQIVDKTAYAGLDRSSRAAYEGLRSAIADCQAAGYLRSGEVDAMAVAAWAAVHGLAMLLIDKQIPPAAAEPPGGSLQPATDLVLSLLYEGIRAPTE